MTDTNVFTQKSQDNNEGNEGDTVLQAKIDELKSRSVDDLAKGKAHADAFIDHLKGEIEQLRKDLAERKQVEDALAELKAARNEPNDSEGNTNSGLKPEDIKTLVAESLNEQQTKSKVQANILAVDKAVKEQYGDKAHEFIAKKASELGMSVEDLASVASKSPNAFFNLVGFNKETKAPGTSGLLESSVNVDRLAETNNLKQGTHAYYEALRKKDKVLYYSPEVQRKLFADRVRLGDDFYK